MTALDVVDLLTRIVHIPSVSGNEAAVRDWLAERLAEAGASPRIEGRNLWAARGSGSPVLVLNSHYDTVKAGEGWTRDPWAAERAGERIYGLGANDAKASVASLAAAFLAAKLPPEGAGTLVYTAVCDEETGGQGLETLVKVLPEPSAAIVGEPTGNLPCPGQRGLVRMSIHERGRAGHASRPEEGINAIERAAEDIRRLMGMEWPGEDALLGGLTLQVTMIQGGVAKNVIPPSCSMTLDIRTVPAWPNPRVIERIREVVLGEVQVTSERFTPIAWPEGSALPAAAREAAGAWGSFRGVSDLFHLRAVPGVVLGPGASERSHAPDEFIEEVELRRAVEVYRNTIEGYFRRARP